MAVRIVAGAVMPNAMRMAAPCSVLGTWVLWAHGLGFVHAGWAMPRVNPGVNQPGHVTSGA